LIFADPLFDLPQAALAQAVTEAGALNLPESEGMAMGASTGMRSASEIGRVPRLPGTLNEARRVASGIERLTKHKPQTFLQSRALEERVKRIRSPEILHVATHGFALPDQHVPAGRFQLPLPDALGGQVSQRREVTTEGRLEDPLLRCGILLTGCNLAAADRPKGVEDGCLTGKEIVGLDLRGTELVVLSACDTGTGRVQYGEGVAGLRQAFLIAGADAVLATLWPVPDSPTADLVAGFFDHLAAGKDKANALRQAQLDLINIRRTANGAAHPAAWAAFELTGR
jgi:CHAT domain-containing protein